MKTIYNNSCSFLYLDSTYFPLSIVKKTRIPHPVIAPCPRVKVAAISAIKHV